MTFRRLPRTAPRPCLAPHLVVVVVTALGLAACGDGFSPASLAERAHDRVDPPTASEGAVSGRGTVFDDDLPAVANLQPELLDALRRAATDAAVDDIALSVSSGWRSAALQDQLLEEAVRTYGSEQEAARWVATPERSAHVSGEAVDIATVDGILWLSEHGATYGLCQIYENESWHFELRPGAVTDGCPPMYADPTEDPRLQQ